MNNGLNYAWVLLHQCDEFYRRTGHPVNCDADKEAVIIGNQKDGE